MIQTPPHIQDLREKLKLFVTRHGGSSLSYTHQRQYMHVPPLPKDLMHQSS